MAVALGTNTTGAINAGATTTTISVVSTAQPLYVRVPHWQNSGAPLTGITYGGVALTKIAESAQSTGGDRCAIWRLLAPTAGTADLVLTFSATGSAGMVAAANTTGQDTATPEGTVVTNASTVNATTTGNLAVSPVAGDLTIWCTSMDAIGGAYTHSATGGGSVTEEMDTASGGEQCGAAKVPDAATAVSTSWGSANAWAVAAVVLNGTPPPPAAISAGTLTWGFPHPPMRVT